MTNKMPVVGKRYRLIRPATKYLNEEIIVTSVDPTKTRYKVPEYNFDGNTFTDTFFYLFEELPEDNLQEKKEVSEVDRALEELKSELKDWFEGFPDFSYQSLSVITHGRGRE